jgi:hypothetical protein
MEKREHRWTYDEGYEDSDGHYSGDGELYCDVCHQWRTHKRLPDGTEDLSDYIAEEDEQDCPGYPPYPKA